MINTTNTDAIDELLNRVAIEAEAEYAPNYATFFQRAIARTVDTALMFGLAYGFQKLMMGFIISDNNINLGFVIDSVKEATPAFALMIYSMIYSPIMEATGGTVGKRLVRIKLVEAGKPNMAPFRNYMSRSVIYLLFVVLSAPFLMTLETLFKEPTLTHILTSAIAICFAPSFVSCLAFFISNHHQTWHDKISNVMCVKK